MPTLTAPELRRKKLDRVEEFKRLSTETTKDGAAPTPEQEQQLNAIFSEIEVGGSFDRQIKAAEQFAVAEGLAAQSREGAGRVTAPLEHDGLDESKPAKHRYSMLKAIRESYGWGVKKGVRGPDGLTGLEAEVHVALCKRRGPDSRAPEGVLVPNTLPVDMYAARRWGEAIGVRSEAIESYAYTTAELATTVESTLTGAGAIYTRLGTMIDILRTRTVLGAMGITVMNDMQGLFGLPRQASTTQAYWIAEGQDTTQSAPTIDQVMFTPHTIAARTPYTRRFLEQTSVDAENFIRTDHAAVIVRGIESAALNGTGTGGQPLGIMQNPLIPLIAAGTNGGAPTWANVVAMETALANVNADIDPSSTGYIIDTAVRGLFKTTLKNNVAGATYLWEPGNQVNGYKAGVTNLLPNNLVHGGGTGLHAMMFGVWSQMVMAFWSGLDVIVNPYSADASGSVIITSLQDCDVDVKHPESFVKMMDVLVV
jgi:HK97 family phage major capsid protein